MYSWHHEEAGGGLASPDQQPVQGDSSCFTTAEEITEARHYAYAAYQPQQPQYLPRPPAHGSQPPYIPPSYPSPRPPPFPSSYPLLSHEIAADPSASQQSWRAQDRQIFDHRAYYESTSSNSTIEQELASFGVYPPLPLESHPSRSALFASGAPQQPFQQHFSQQDAAITYPLAAPIQWPSPKPPLPSPHLSFQDSALGLPSDHFLYPRDPLDRPRQISQSSGSRHAVHSSKQPPVILSSLPDETIRHEPAAATLAHVASMRRGQLSPLMPSHSPNAAGYSTSRLGSLAGRGGRGGGTKKLHSELAAACWSCGDEKARLVLRGQDVEEMIPRCHLQCLKCAQIDPKEETERGRRSASEQAAQDEWTYQDTLSAAVDMLEGIKLEDEGKQDNGWPQSELPASVKADAISCDVCSFILGLGSIKASTPAGPAKFTVEVICSLCDSLYRPCSDCGGGGGRLTPGRWRCKELFAANRKTCILPHSRTPALSELSFEFFNIVDIPASRIDEIEDTCRGLFYNARMGAIARPELLAHSDGLASSFAQVERSTIDSWNLLAPLLREDVEVSRGIRRFVALEHAVPRARQKGKTEGKAEPYGFYIVELQLDQGVNFFAALAPYATTGSSFDSHWHFGAFVMKEIKASLAKTNAVRARQHFSPYPPITANFLLSGFKSDSRFNGSLLRRGYKPLSEHIKEHPDLPAFHRPLHIPVPYAHVWHIWVFAVQDGEDFAPPPRLASRRKKRIVSVEGTSPSPLRS